MKGIFKERVLARLLVGAFVAVMVLLGGCAVYDGLTGGADDNAAETDVGVNDGGDAENQSDPPGELRLREEGVEVLEDNVGGEDLRLRRQDIEGEHRICSEERCVRGRISR